MYWKCVLYSQVLDFKIVVFILYKEVFDLKKNLDKFIQCISFLFIQIIKNININVKSNGFLVDMGYVFCNVCYFYIIKENIFNLYVYY